MNNEPPPTVDPRVGLSPAKPANLARLGMRLSLLAPLVILLFLLIQPG